MIHFGPPGVNSGRKLHVRRNSSDREMLGSLCHLIGLVDSGKFQQRFLESVG